MGFRSYRFSISFPWGPRSWTKTLWSQKNPSKGTQTKRLSTEVVSGHKNRRVTVRGVFLQKALEEFESSCLGQCLVGWMLEWWIAKNPLLKKKQQPKNEWSAKIPTKTDSTERGCFKYLWVKRDFFVFWNINRKGLKWDPFFKPFFCWWCFLMGGHLIAKPSVPIPVMKHPSRVAPQAEKPPSRSCSRESRRWDGRGEIWLKVKCVKGKGCGEVTWTDWEQAHQRSGKFALRPMLKLSTFWGWLRLRFSYLLFL